MALTLLTWFCTVVLIVASNESAGPRAELRLPLGRIVTSEDDIGNRRRHASRWEIGGHRPRVGGPIEPGRRRRKRPRALDLFLVVLQPLAVVEGDRTDNTPPPSIRRGEPSVLDRALREDDLVAEGGHAD